MGQKCNPIGLRLGIIGTWQSRWFAKKDYAKLLHEDIRIREYITKSLPNAGLAKVEIERAAKNLKINVHTSRPGIVIGKKGAGAEKLKEKIKQLCAHNSDKEVVLNILEVKRPNVEASLVADNIALQLERRVSFRRAMRNAMNASVRSGAKGIRVRCAGRLGGAEMARSEWYREGRVPLHTLRGDISYATAEANTTYGIIGVKVWVYRGEVIGKKRLDKTT